MELKFITGNIGKFDEARALIGDSLIRVDIDLPEIQSLDPQEVIQFKLTTAQAQVSGPFIVEDASVNLEAFNGFPGPLMKWLELAIGNDGIAETCRKLGNYTAEHRVTYGYYSVAGDIRFFEAVTRGQIVAPRGKNGFGFDPIFQPEGSEKTYAEMNFEQKQAFSPRTKALMQLKNYIRP